MPGLNRAILLPHNRAQVEIVAVLDGDGVAVGGHDPRRDLAGAGVFGLTGARASAA